MDVKQRGRVACPHCKIPKRGGTREAEARERPADLLPAPASVQAAGAARVRARLPAGTDLASLGL